MRSLREKNEGRLKRKLFWLSLSFTLMFQLYWRPCKSAGNHKDGRSIIHSKKYITCPDKLNANSRFIHRIEHACPYNIYESKQEMSPYTLLFEWAFMSNGSCSTNENDRIFHSPASFPFTNGSIHDKIQTKEEQKASSICESAQSDNIHYFIGRILSV